MAENHEAPREGLIKKTLNAPPPPNAERPPPPRPQAVPKQRISATAAWQPIGTAPKTPLTKPAPDALVELGPRLLFWSGGSGSWPITGRWVEPHHGKGWWGMDGSRMGIPTHWMPLPEPPHA